MDTDRRVIRILATSDLHGKMVPWSYAVNEKDDSGSAAQLASAIAEYRTDRTVYVDAGDLIQDNSADLFIDDPVHPMVQALNRLGCDIWVTGNHEYDFDMETVRKTIRTLDALTLTGNVYLPDRSPLAPGWVILERDGIRLAFIGMESMNIARWNEKNLAGCTVTDALDETRKIIDAIKGRYDVLIGVFHMTIDNECAVNNTGVTDICNACPEFDVMISSHGHLRIPEMYINDVLVVQNAAYAKTMSMIDLVFEQQDGVWKLAERKPECIDIGPYPCDPEFMKLFEPYHQRALRDAEIQIGNLRGGPLAEENEVQDIPRPLIENTALIDFINRVQMYYSGAAVSATALFSLNANLHEGPVRKCDTALIYRYPNSLCKVSMTGRQLRKFMEYCAGFYNRFQPGDLTVSFNPQIKNYSYMMFSGVNYEINIAKETGSRIEHLTWPDGTPVRDDDRFEIAVNGYCANSYLLQEGEIFQKGEELPQLLEADIHSEIGSIREMIGNYIQDVLHGDIRPAAFRNWRLTGTEWDKALHEKAMRLVNEGKLQIPAAEDGTKNVRSIRTEDLPPE